MITSQNNKLINPGWNCISILQGFICQYCRDKIPEVLKLVECAWQTMSNMARAYNTDMQMPKACWDWALWQSVQAMNYLPFTVESISTTPHELVYGVKPDLWVLFWMFSTGYFRHNCDSTESRHGIGTSKTMQGIALGRCCKSDRMIFYSPHTKEIICIIWL
jgi:hypothetical protein